MLLKYQSSTQPFSQLVSVFWVNKRADYLLKVGLISHFTEKIRFLCTVRFLSSSFLEWRWKCKQWNMYIATSVHQFYSVWNVDDWANVRSDISKYLQFLPAFEHFNRTTMDTIFFHSWTVDSVPKSRSGFTIFIAFHHWI